MSPALQAKLLQVLQDGEFSRLGGEADVKVDTRILAATNRDLEKAVKQGEFREDLYYRLNVVTILIPPLRERPGTIPLLVDHFVRKFAEEYRKEPRQLSAETLGILASYHWPGNVRELENMIRRMMVLGNEEAVVKDIARRDATVPDASSEFLDLDALTGELAAGNGIDLKAISKRAAQMAEKRVIERVLDETRWNRKEAAARLQVSYKALLYKMKDNGLTGNR
jgi:two-component system response regulator AtoC